ncbi:hypothetical protein FFLO_05817 [Filobasidium floriforme]|uniref:Uncharacterized protein n=1 Tax=Filobasidium floriforme TaxID=5210 RepID=A0A8K0JG36_9TREE|nr:hypothetical protein FFLO_05817 [Filobasidium floriforme]
MAIIIPEKWKDLIDGAKLLALYQQSDTRPSDSMWNISSKDQDRSAAVSPHKGWITSHEDKENQETYQELSSCTQQREGPTRAKYGPDAGILHCVCWIAKGQARCFPIVSLYNIKGSYANRTVRTFHDELQPFFQLVSNLFRLLDPEQYQLYRQQMDRLANTQADLAIYLQESPCLFLGLALVCHLCVTPHVRCDGPSFLLRES